MFFVFEVQADNADGGVGFVDIAVGDDAQIVFRAAGAVGEARLPGIAGAGVDFVELDHYFPPIANISMSAKSASPCSDTRATMSVFAYLALAFPPRLISTTPASNTPTTEMSRSTTIKSMRVI